MDKQTLTAQALSARTPTEIQEVREVVADWLTNHPDDEFYMMVVSEQLAMVEDESTANKS